MDEEEEEEEEEDDDDEEEEEEDEEGVDDEESGASELRVSEHPFFAIIFSAASFKFASRSGHHRQDSWARIFTSRPNILEEVKNASVTGAKIPPVTLPS